jgi:hypothetical protein
MIPYLASETIWFLPCTPGCRYVEQQDIHSAGTTVREALQFSARLRLTQDIGMAQIHQIVDDTLEMVDMGGLRDSIVGDPGERGQGGCRGYAFVLCSAMEPGLHITALPAVLDACNVH